MQGKNINISIEDRDKCSICLDDLDSDLSYLPCCHGFHQRCFASYITEKIQNKKCISCPLCRKEHFQYGDKSYEFIKNHLGISYGNDAYDQYIPRGFNSIQTHRVNGNTPNDTHQHIVTIPVAVNSGILRNVYRDRRYTTNSTYVVWLKYRYYIIGLILILVISGVSFLVIKSSLI